MRHLKQTFSRIYFDTISKLFSKLYNKLNNSKEEELKEKNDITAQKSFFRILVFIVILAAIAWLISIFSGEISLFYSIISYIFVLLAVGIVSSLFIILLDEYFKTKIISDYKLAAEKWNQIDNASPLEKKQIIQAFFKNKRGRKLRYGELKRIKRNAQYNISFRNDKYLYNDRLLTLQFVLYGPIMSDWDKNFHLTKISRFAVLLSVSIIGISVLIISYLFQKKTIDGLHWYVMRGISPDFENQSQQKDSGGVIKQWQEDSFKKVCIQAYQNIEKKNVTRLKKELPSIIKESDLFPNIDYLLTPSAFHKNKTYRNWIRESTDL